MRLLPARSTFVAKVLTDQDHYGLRDSTAGNTASIMIVTVMLLLASAGISIFKPAQ